MNVENDIGIIHEYSTIFQDFQINVRTILNVYSELINGFNDLVQNHIHRRDVQNTNTFTRTPLFNIRTFTNNAIETRNINRNRNNRNHTRTNAYNSRMPYPNRNVSFSYDNLEPIVVRPSPIQILTAVEYTVYDQTSMLQDSDPIDQTDFVHGEHIIRIRECGHCFRPVNFDTWFSSNVRCPLCRLDIRENLLNNNTTNETNQMNDTSTQDINTTNHDDTSNINIENVQSNNTNEILSNSDENNNQASNLNESERQLLENLITYANTLIGDLDI